jgi:hypothetical protein
MYHLNDLSGTCHPDGYRDCGRGKEYLPVAVFFSLTIIAYSDIGLAMWWYFVFRQPITVAD